MHRSMSRGVRGEDGPVYKTISLVHRLACVVFLAVVDHFAMVLAEHFGLNGDEGPREDSTAGSARKRRPGQMTVRGHSTA